MKKLAIILLILFNGCAVIFHYQPVDSNNSRTRNSFNPNDSIKLKASMDYFYYPHSLVVSLKFNNLSSTEKSIYLDSIFLLDCKRRKINYKLCKGQKDDKKIIILPNKTYEICLNVKNYLVNLKNDSIFLKIKTNDLDFEGLFVLKE